MERRKGNLVFPTSVYLDNLASSVSHSSSVSRSQVSSGASSPSVGGGERNTGNMFEVRETVTSDQCHVVRGELRNNKNGLFVICGS